jgi:MYXO-CTERM domain-containing protein
MRSLTFVWVVVLLGSFSPLSARAQGTWGPWTFPDERPFADSARSVGAPIGSIQGDVAELAGYLPDSCITNLGYPCEVGAQIVEFTFTDVPVENREGHDLVVFDAPYSQNEYEIAVKPPGAEFTDYRVFLPSVETGRDGCGSSAWVLGVPVDLSDFGLADGVRLDAVRIKGDCATNPQTTSDGSELDIVMAAALRGANRCAATTACKNPCPGVDDCTPPTPDCVGDQDCGEFGRCSPEGKCIGCSDDSDCTSGHCTRGRCEPASQCEGEDDAGACDEPSEPDEPDAATDEDAGSPAAVMNPPSEAGCGCRVGRAKGAWMGWMGLVSLLTLLVLRRNRA